VAARIVEHKSRTVIVAADLGSYSLPIVNLAVEIAAAMDSKLQGLFVEDEDLLTLCESPLAREIMLTTASARPGSSARMGRMLRSVARQFEAALQREAQAWKIDWSYEYVRGRIQDVRLDPRFDAAMTVLGRSGLRGAESRRGRLRKILVIADHSSTQAQALGVVLRRYAGERIEITLVDEQHGGEAKQELLRRVVPLELEVALVEIDRAQMHERLRLSGSAYDCAILPMREEAQELAIILKALQCPVILVT